MKLSDLINRSSFILGEDFGAEAIIFYNEFINFLCNKKPEYASKINSVEFECNNIKDDKYFIPESTLFVTGIYKDGNSSDFKCVDNVISFLEKGTYTIKYTIYPKLANYIDATLNHNPDFDDCITYYLCYKKAVSEQYPQNLCNIYYSSFNDLFNSACKNVSKVKQNYIPCDSFL